LKIIQLYGLRRSGTHALVGWLKHNFTSALHSNRFCFLNDVVEMRERFVTNFEYSKKNCDVLINTYEDTSSNLDLISEPSHKIVLIRDIFNLAASRIKRGTDDMKVDENFVNLWLEHSQSTNLFKYEDFLLNKEKRDELCLKLDVDNLDHTEEVLPNGFGSSFIGIKLDTKENYLNRYKMVEFSDNVVKLLSDSCIQEAREKLGYSVL
jgi:hypothetical protein